MFTIIVKRYTGFYWFLTLMSFWKFTVSSFVIVHKWLTKIIYKTHIFEVTNSLWLIFKIVILWRIASFTWIRVLLDFILLICRNNLSKGSMLICKTILIEKIWCSTSLLIFWFRMLIIIYLFRFVIIEISVEILFSIIQIIFFIFLLRQWWIN